MREIDDQADIFKKWQKYIMDEWAKRDAVGSYIKQNQDQIFRDWIIQKIVACFTMAEINGKRIAELERKSGNE